jgi:AsmA protein
MPRVLLIPLVLLVLLIVTAALLLPVLVDKEKVLRLAAETLHEHTGATLTVAGDAKLSVFPTLGVALSDAAITLPEQRQAELNGGAVHIGALRIGVQLLPLLRGKVEINTLVLDGVKASMQAGATQENDNNSARSDADLDALYAIRRERMAASAQAASTPTPMAMPLALHVKQLTITNARLEILDTGGAAPKVIELVHLHASDLNLEGAPIPVDLSLRLPGKQVIDVNVKGGVRVDLQHQNATLEEVQLTVTGALANTLQLRTSGVLDLSRQSADLQLALEVGETRGTGTLRYASFESPQIDSVLQLNRLEPALLALAGPDALAAAAPTGDEPLPLDALRAIDAHTVLDIEQARFGAHTVNNLHTAVHAIDGVIQIAELSGDLHGGKLNASGTLNARHQAVTLETSGTLTHFDLASTLTALESKAALSGSGTLDWQLRSQGNSTNALTAAMHGPIHLLTEEVVLQGLSVEKLLCVPVALSNQEALTATFPADTRFTTLAADIQLAAGQATLDPLQAKVPGVSLSGTGSFDLLKKNFDATFKARLSAELEQLDHACRVSNRLTAIDVPVHCAGTVGTEPGTWCRVDATKIAQDLTINEVKEKLEKKAGKLFNKLFNKGD